MSSFALPVPQLTKNDFGLPAAAAAPAYTFSSYTPAWTSGGTQPVLGNGTLTGTYVRIGNVVVGSLVLTMGSTTTFGTGAYAFSMPVAAAGNESGGVLGTALGSDTGVAAYAGFVTAATTTTMNVYTPASPAAAWTNASPFTFGSGDTAFLKFLYQAA